MIRTAIITGSILLFHGLATTERPPIVSATPDLNASSTFTWSGTIPDGGWLKIRNLAGTIEVRRTSGKTVDVHATQESGSDSWLLWFNRSTQPVKFVTQRQASNVVICTVAEKMPDCNADDLTSRSGNGWGDNWHPQPMHIVVDLPAGVLIQAGTMHGDLTITDPGAAVIARSGHGTISIDDAAGTVAANTGHGNIDIVNAAQQVTATTGHGNIHISSAGAVVANTGHGDIVAELTGGSAVGTTNMTFDTGHGNVSVVAPKALNGDVNLHSGHGEVSTNFPLTMGDEKRHSHADSAHGVLGSGTRAVKLSTGHGDVSLTSGD